MNVARNSSARKSIPRLNSRRVRESRGFDSRIPRFESLANRISSEARPCRFFPRDFFDLFVNPELP